MPVHPQHWSLLLQFWTLLVVTTFFYIFKLAIQNLKNKCLITLLWVMPEKAWLYNLIFSFCFQLYMNKGNLWLRCLKAHYIWIIRADVNTLNKNEIAHWWGKGVPVVSESSRTQCAAGAWLRCCREAVWIRGGGGCGEEGLLTHLGASGGVRKGGCWRLDSHANLGNQGDGPGPKCAWWTVVISGKRWNETVGRIKRQVCISFFCCFGSAQLCLPERGPLKWRAASSRGSVGHR